MAMRQSSSAHAESSSSAAEGQLPWIFLSHSGHQKDFTRRLNQTLLRARHQPFFDEDADRSLPKGHPYPHRILEACQGCKMGIIVLSHQYIESFWPMLELQHLKNAQVLLYPLFYEMQPADLTSDENLQCWQRIWEGWLTRKGPVLQKAISLQGSQLQINMDITSWPAALNELKYRSGNLLMNIARTNYSSEDAYLEAIVSNVCRTLPPPRRYMVIDDIMGASRMQQDIDELFKKQAGGADGVTVLGVHGIGGSGKTTLCLNMANYYSKDFPGRSCCLELPTSSEHESKQLLLHNIKAILPTFGQSGDDRISTLEEAMSSLQEGLNRSKIFLALDNVWDAGFDTAKKIMLMNCMRGSKIMVTSRAKEVLEALLRCREEKTSRSGQQHILKINNIVHVPSITEAEAMQALGSYSCFSHFIPAEPLRSLARSCFFGEKCHPLYLKTIGSQLRAMGRAYFSGLEWKNLLSQLQAHEVIRQGDKEGTIFAVLQRSFERLSPELQNIFKDLVTCMPKGYKYQFLQKKCEWLSFLHAGSTTETMKNQLRNLEYHGLLEMIPSYSSEDVEVSIHDLHKLVARKTLSPDAHGNHFLDLDQQQLDSLPFQEESLLYKYKYICGSGRISRYWGTWLCRRYNLEILHLEIIDEMCPSVITVNSMKALRILKLRGFYNVKEVSGWEGAPNLVSLKLSWFAHLIEIGHLGSLLKLEELALKHCGSLKVLTVGELQKLRILKLHDNFHLECVFFTQNNSTWSLPNLEVLVVYNCWFLNSFPNLRDFKAAGLRALRVRGQFDLGAGLNRGDCSLSSSLVNLQQLDLGAGLNMTGLGLSSLVNLQQLDLRMCESLKEITGLSSLVNLQRLRLEWCESLKQITGLQGALTKLESMHVRECSSLQQIVSLGTHLTKLETLAIIDCPLLTFQGLLQPGFDEAGPSKRDVCRGTSEQVFDVLPPLPTSLTHLDLRGSCYSLTDASNLTSLTSLEYLDLRGCTSLKELPNLEHLPTRRLQHIYVNKITSW